MPRLQESKGKFTIVVPKEFVERKGWKKGQVLIFAFNENGNIILME